MNLPVPPSTDTSRVPPMRPPDRQVVYKKAGGVELKLHIYLPPHWKAADQRPAIVLFFGGGWRIGTYEQFLAKAEYLAGRGLVAFCAEYRVESRDRVTVDKCVEDARSAMRYVRGHVGELGVDAGKLIGAGGSAGAHMAVCTACLDQADDPDDDLKISCKPQALVLFNPPLDLSGMFSRPEFAEIANRAAAGDSQEAKKRFLARYSPIEFVKPGLPPAILFFGEDDLFLPDARRYAVKSVAQGNHVEIWIASCVGHGFFNAAPWHQATLIKTDEFLTSLGYLRGVPTIQSVDPDAKLIADH